jgi:ankyrin repeat protein
MAEPINTTMPKELELLAAIQKADLHAIQQLIEEGADVNYKDDDNASYGYTWPLLHHCIFKQSSRRKKEHITAAALLLDNGADMECVNFTGETPALFAIKYFSPAIFELLIQKGANSNAVNKQGYNLYDIVLDRYYYDQRLDMDHIEEETDEAAIAAIKKGEGPALGYMFERIDALVANGYDLNAGQYPALLCTLLEIQKETMPVKVAHYLVEKGADPNIKIP